MTDPIDDKLLPRLLPPLLLTHRMRSFLIIVTKMPGFSSLQNCARSSLRRHPTEVRLARRETFA